MTVASEIAAPGYLTRPFGPRGMEDFAADILGLEVVDRGDSSLDVRRDDWSGAHDVRSTTKLYSRDVTLRDWMHAIRIGDVQAIAEALDDIRAIGVELGRRRRVGGQKDMMLDRAKSRG